MASCRELHCLAITQTNVSGMANINARIYHSLPELVALARDMAGLPPPLPQGVAVVAMQQQQHVPVATPVAHAVPVAQYEQAEMEQDKKQ